jgi:hypothetical protein
MRLTLTHRFAFGGDSRLVGHDLVRPEAWDALRMLSAGPFAIPASRDALEQAADARPELEARACSIDAIVTGSGASSLASYGVGAALLELWLLRLAPERRLVVTDYAPTTVERLRMLLPEAAPVRHDLLSEPPLAADIHLFHRIDTELDNADWRSVFRRFANCTVLVVATEILGAGGILREVLNRSPHRRTTRAGWARTRGAFEALWADTHRARPVVVHDHEGWLLMPRGGR